MWIDICLFIVALFVIWLTWAVRQILAILREQDEAIRQMARILKTMIETDRKITKAVKESRHL